jgi:hypothetical protein
MNDLCNALLPPEIRSFLTITEIDHPRLWSRDLFVRKYGEDPPDTPHHIVAIYHQADASSRVIGYTHMHPFGDVYLSGGSCADGDNIRRMEAEHSSALRSSGGVLLWMLRYAMLRYADRCDAFFGYSGDARAYEVCLDAGFIPTGHQHLLVRWHKELHPHIQRALVAKVHALGSF